MQNRSKCITVRERNFPGAMSLHKEPFCLYCTIEHMLYFALLFSLIADILLLSIYFSSGKNHIHMKKMCVKLKIFLDIEKSKPLVCVFLFLLS